MPFHATFAHLRCVKLKSAPVEQAASRFGPLGGHSAAGRPAWFHLRVRGWPEKAETWLPLTGRVARGGLSTPASPRQLKGARDRRRKRLPVGKTDLIQSNSDKHFLHTSVLLRHASGDAGEAEQQIETILTKAVVAKRRVWVSSILFAELRPSMFVRGRFATLFELTRYLRSLATLVTPDPNTMMRAARLRDAKWQRPAGVRQADEKPRSMSLSDAIQIASALWVKEVIGVPDLEFLMFDGSSSNEAGGGRRLSLLGLKDYAQNADGSRDHMAAVRSTRIEPVLPARSNPHFASAGARSKSGPGVP